MILGYSSIGSTLYDFVSLAPDTLWFACGFFAFLFFFAYLIRTAYMSEACQSVGVHIVVCTLTLLPAIALGLLLLVAGYEFPERVWINLGVAALLFVPWGLGGACTRLARSDTEGADIGWMAMGALITFPCGLLAALVF